MMKVIPRSYPIQRLNFWNENSWAVIEIPSGAIASGPRGALLMRLSKAKAHEAAQVMSAELLMQADVAIAPTTHYRDIRLN